LVVSSFKWFVWLLLLFTSEEEFGHHAVEDVCCWFDIVDGTTGSLDNVPKLQNGGFGSVSCPFGDVTSTDDGSGADQNLNQELFVGGFVDSVDDGTVDWNNSFHVEARCVRVLDDGKRGVAVPNTDDHTDASSLGGCRCCSFIVDISANGFCICVVNGTVGLWIFVNGHDESYFDGHSVDENVVQGIFGVDKSFIGIDELLTFGVDGTVDVVLFWWSKRRFIWSSTSGVPGDWIEFVKYDDVDCWLDVHASLFGRWIGPGPCCGNGNGSTSSLIIDEGIVSICEIFVGIIDGGGGDVDIDISDGISLIVDDDGGCCVHSLIPFDSFIHCSVCETYRPKFDGEKDIKLSILN